MITSRPIPRVFLNCGHAAIIRVATTASRAVRPDTRPLLAGPHENAVPSCRNWWGVTARYPRPLNCSNRAPHSARVLSTLDGIGEVAITVAQLYLLRHVAAYPPGRVNR